MKTASVVSLAVGVVALGVAGVAVREALDPDPVSREAWDVKPARVSCEWVTALDERAKTYVRLQVCDEEKTDGGKPYVRSGLIAFGETKPGDGGAYRIEAGEFECACSTGRDCERLAAPSPGAQPAWAAAPTGITIGDGLWRGAGCIRKACTELFRSDVTSWPDDCPGG